MDIREWIEKAARLRMPSLGNDEPYFLGSGAVGASGRPGGVWDFAIGPDLTSPNYLKREEIFADGVGALPFQMFRLRGCGAFFGMAAAGGLRATVTEACAMEGMTLLRYVTLENEGNEPMHTSLDVRIETDGPTARGVDYIEVVKEPGAWCFGNRETRNWAERRMRIRLPGARVIPEGGAYRLRREVTLGSGEMAAFPLWHEFAYGNDYPEPCQPEAYLEEALDQWSRWLQAGTAPENIRRGRLRDAVESLLLTVKMQQNRDGGMIAGIRKYANSYIRDCHGGCRMLLACGHLQEAEKLLLNIHTRWEKAGFIPNWWSMGSDTFIGRSFHNDAAEITAYYIFMLRDYLARGGDKALARRVLPSIRWAADAQAEFLEKHDLMMDFNGDETEQYCAARDGEEYGLFGTCHARDRMGFQTDHPSYASTAAAAGSLEWFGKYVGESSYVELAEKTREGLRRFWSPERGRHGWILDGGKPRDTYLTNASLLPLWLGIAAEDGREKDDALIAVRDRREDTGCLPNCPGVVEGYCGHTLGMALYDMLALDRPEAEALLETILYSHLLGRYGTVSEFYGPGGVANGHGNRPFEGGIVGEALVEMSKRGAGVRIAAFQTASPKGQGSSAGNSRF